MTQPNHLNEQDKAFPRGVQDAVVDHWLENSEPVRIVQLFSISHVISGALQAGLLKCALASALKWFKIALQRKTALNLNS